MTCQKRGRPEFPEVFPVEKALVDGFKAEDKSAVVLVDVGGGMGQEITMLRQMLPEIPGRTILQEVPELAKQAAGTDGIEVMEHDFFTPQPVHGARAYCFRNIFHDWSDDNCTKILHQTKSAMIPGYSKLLINDLVVTDQKAGLFMTRSDMTMLALLGSMERSEKQWRQLLDGAGFVVVKIWTKEARYESVIEAMIGKEENGVKSAEGEQNTAAVEEKGSEAVTGDQGKPEHVKEKGVKDLDVKHDGFDKDKSMAGAYPD